MAYGVAPFRNFPVGLCSPLALAFVLAAWDPARAEGALVAPRYILVSLQTSELRGANADSIRRVPRLGALWPR